MTQNDQRIVGVVLSNISPPPPSPEDCQWLRKDPGTAAKEWEGEVQQRSFRPPSPPPTRINFPPGLSELSGVLRVHPLIPPLAIVELWGP